MTACPHLVSLCTPPSKIKPRKEELDNFLKRMLNKLYLNKLHGIPLNATIELRIKCPIDRWDFKHSLVFSITTITTIGYGSWKPTSSHGQIFCVCYATIGIPLFLCLVIVWVKGVKRLETNSLKFFAHRMMKQLKVSPENRTKCKKASIYKTILQAFNSCSF